MSTKTKPTKIELCPMCKGRQAFKDGERPTMNPFNFRTQPESWHQWRLGYYAEKEVR